MYSMCVTIMHSDSLHMCKPNEWFPFKVECYMFLLQCLPVVHL